MNDVRLPLALSVAGHAAALAVLAWVAVRLPPLALPRPAPPEALEVVFAAPEPPPPAAPPAVEPPPPPTVEPPPPPPEPPPVKAETPPPPPPKPVARKPVARRTPPPPEPVPVARPPAPATPRPPMPAQTAALPPSPPLPTITAEYRAALGGWLEHHKHYPENARARGEEGRCVLRFRVERSGRVQSYAIVASSGYADLDAAVEAMMQGAVLPPFPAAMTAPAVEVSVTIRFALTR